MKKNSLMEDLISVIVPVYNVEAYLDRCMHSVLNQTYQNLEILLIDDGSTDGSPALCDAYATRDRRIKVLHKPNGGLSDARNAGLALAQGAYIGQLFNNLQVLFRCRNNRHPLCLIALYG